MNRGEIRSQRNTFPQWHRSQVVSNVVRLSCTCGAIVYTGPTPKFSRVSCPKCKKIHEVPKEMRK